MWVKVIVLNSAIIPATLLNSWFLSRFLRHCWIIFGNDDCYQFIVKKHRVKDVLTQKAVKTSKNKWIKNGLRKYSNAFHKICKQKHLQCNIRQNMKVPLQNKEHNHKFANKKFCVTQKTAKICRQFYSKPSMLLKKERYS